MMHDPNPLGATGGAAKTFRRRVFYIPGYDPFHPRRYRELYRKEGGEQARISGYTIDLKPKKTKGPYGWHAAGMIDGQRTEADIEVLVWSDIVSSIDVGLDRSHLPAADPHRLGLYRIGRAVPADAAAQGADDRGALPDRLPAGCNCWPSGWSAGALAADRAVHPLGWGPWRSAPPSTWACAGSGQRTTRSLPGT
jgi:hypothetical protein